MQTSLCPVARGGTRKVIPFEDRLKEAIDGEIVPEIEQAIADYVWREMGRDFREELNINRINIKCVGYELEYERPKSLTDPVPHIAEGNVEVMLRVFFDTVRDDGDRMKDWYYDHRMYFVRFSWPDPQLVPTINQYSSMDYLKKSIRGAVSEARLKHRRRSNV